LRAEILEKGYDQLEFCNFMEKERENWADLASWTFEEL
jgi:hypothetical protein